MSMSELTCERSHLSATELTRERSQKVRERYQRIEEQAARPHLVSNLRSFSYDMPTQHAEMERMVRARSDSPAPAPMPSPMPVAESPPPMLEARVFLPPAHREPVALRVFGRDRGGVLELQDDSEADQAPEALVVFEQVEAASQEATKEDSSQQEDGPPHRDVSSHEKCAQQDAQQQDLPEQHRAAQQCEHEHALESLASVESLRMSLCTAQTAS